MSDNKQHQVLVQINHQGIGEKQFGEMRDQINNQYDKFRWQQQRELEQLPEQPHAFSSVDLDKLQISMIEKKRTVGSEFQQIGNIIQLDQIHQLSPQSRMQNDKNKLQLQKEVFLKRQNPQFLKDEIYKLQIQSLKKNIVQMDDKLLQCQRDMEKLKKQKIMVLLQYKKLKDGSKKKEETMNRQIQNWKRKYKNENLNGVIFAAAYDKDKIQLKEMIQFYTCENNRLEEEIKMAISERQKEVGQFKLEINAYLDKAKERQVFIQKIKEQFLQFKEKSKKQNEKLRQLLAEKQVIITKNGCQSKQNQDKINQKNKEIQRITEQLGTIKNKFQLSLKQVQSAKEKMELEVKKWKYEKQNLVKQNSKAQQEIKRMEKDKKQLIVQLEEEKKKLNNLIKISKEKEIQQNKKITEIRHQLQYQKAVNFKKIDQLTQEVKIMEDQSEIKLNKKQTQIHYLSKQLSAFKESLAPIQEIMMIPLIDRIGEKEIKNCLFERFLRGSYFPNSKILNEISYTKTNFLQRQLKSFLEIKSFSSEMIYKYDPLNERNFHSYIDGRKNIVILIKLINEIVIGGFTAFPFDTKVTERPGKGFLFSLSAQKIFMRKQQPRVTVNTYDSFFFILGSSELRLKSGSNKFFSNFGIANSTFDNNGYPRHDFLGINEGSLPELELQSYQIYEISENKV